MSSIFTASLKDAKSQPCSVGIPTAPITAANIVAVLAGMSAFETAALAVTDAALYSSQVTLSITKNGSYARPTSGYANREAKVVMTITGEDTGNLYTLELPAPDLDIWPFNTDGKEIYYAPFLTLPSVVNDFIAAIENIGAFGVNMETGVVSQFRFVGRNL